LGQKRPATPIAGLFVTSMRGSGVPPLSVVRGRPPALRSNEVGHHNSRLEEAVLG